MNIVLFALVVLDVRLFPRQATMLKVLTLAVELLTGYDREVLAEWRAGFVRVDDAQGSRYVGGYGMVPDVLKRMEWCRARGRWAFREVVMVMGRRSSKTFLSSVVLAWQLWSILCLGNPQKHFGVHPRKRLFVLLFSISRESSVRDQFSALVELVQEAPGFAPYFDRADRRTMWLFTPAQLARGARERGERGLIVVSSAPTKASAGRGPAVVALGLDEIAHVDGSGSTSDADEIYRAATPALAQFRSEAIILMASSPWTQTGRFYEAYLEGLAIDAVTGEPMVPDLIAVQLPSDALYRDNDRADEIEMWPGGRRFEVQARVPFVFDESIERLELLNPTLVAVEYRSQWATSAAAYFPQWWIDKVFAPFVETNGEVGRAGPQRYIAHCDLGLSGSNTALVVGHTERHGDREHTFIDLIEQRKASDFPDGRMDYEAIEAELYDVMLRFRPVLLTFDQYNSELMASRLARRAQREGLGTAVQVMNAGQEKFGRYEKTKTIGSAGLLHLPHHPAAIDEFRFIRADGYKISAPTSGPVQTDDIPDGVTWVVHHANDPNSWVHQGLVDFRTAGTDAKALFAPYYESRRKAEHYNPARGIDRSRRRP